MQVVRAESYGPRHAHYIDTVAVHAGDADDIRRPADNIRVDDGSAHVATYSHPYTTP